MTDTPDTSDTPAASGTPSRPPMRALTPLEGRVVAVLLEKQFTVPDTYPLSLNALAAGCNQKTARSPVMSVSEDEILTAIDGLKSLSLVFEGSSSRVPRFEQNLARVLSVPSQSAALLSTLLLRGAQTAAELRLNTARLHAFADISSVEAFLDELVERVPSLVVKLPRAPGEREHRWMHLLCGEVSLAETASPRAGADIEVSPSELEALRISHRALEVKVARLQALVEEMAGQLGIPVDPERLD
ncbi:YceH family protein [Cupriavidus sp. BIS7]|uniref:YceH family protein n=1 Tax=Cupriavidus sp. BIS7 TaxID=1217718 RepID=UPI000474D800|nr:YceH family protein [Cupriavidus sp. BIS7]